MKRGWLAIGAGAVGAAWLLTGPHALPLYDGIGFPDEPYRYVQPPPGYTKHTPPPSSARATVPFANGLSGNAYLSSDETGPQITVFVGQGSVQAPATTTSVVMTATPMAPHPPLPTDGTIVTNVYRVAPSNATGLSFRARSAHYTPSYISMRAPTAKQPGPQFEVRDAAGHWHDVATQRSGQDIYTAVFTQFGDYALVQLMHPKTTRSSTSGSGGSGKGVLIGVGVGVAVLGVLIGLIRLRRLRSADQ